MEDRLVQYPNRVQLIQVDGQPGVYDIEAVPGTVTANGTPLNKATLLSDTVATLVNNAATPNEALKYLAERVQPIKLGGTGANTVEGILANLGIADYVVEQGTSGIWTYEKWNSGKIKMKGRTTTTLSASGWGASGNAYYNSLSPRAFPFTLASVTYFNWYIQGESGYMMFTMSSSSNTAGGVTTSSTGGLTAGRLVKPSYDLNTDLFFDVEGTWK